MAGGGTAKPHSAHLPSRDTIPQSLRGDGKRKARQAQHGVSCPASEAVVFPKPKAPLRDSARAQRGRLGSTALQVCP